MRQMSVQRRRVVVMASSLAAMSGVGPLLLRHGWMRWAWMGIYAALVVWVIVLMLRLRRDEGCR